MYSVPSIIGEFRHQKRERSHRATTLVEVIVVMTLVSIILAAATGLIVQLRRWDYRVRENAVVADQASRLAEAIRADVRNAVKVTKSSPTTLSIVGRNSEETRYVLESDLCRRESKGPGAQSANLETFNIGPAAAWQVDAAAPGRRPAYQISVERPSPEQKTSRTVPLYIYAVQSNE
jgi:type II secretory pathway pseudopilin PulG